MISTETSDEDDERVYRKQEYIHPIAIPPPRKQEYMAPGFTALNAVGVFNGRNSQADLASYTVLPRKYIKSSVIPSVYIAPGFSDDDFRKLERLRTESYQPLYSLFDFHWQNMFV